MLSDAIAYCLYKIYNQLAIHNAPLFILDLFLPILTTATWEETLQNEIKNAKVFKSLEEFMKDLKTTRKKLRYPYYMFYNNTASASTYGVYIDGTTQNTFTSCTCDGSNNGIWLYFSADSSNCES